MQILGVSCSLVLRGVMLSNYAVARARVSGWGPVSSVGCRFHLEGARLHSCEIREGGFGEANTGCVVKEELLEGGLILGRSWTQKRDLRREVVMNLQLCRCFRVCGPRPIRAG